MIEVRGAKHAYLYFVHAKRRKGVMIITGSSMIPDAADNDDEAEGRASRAAEASYPEDDGWHGHKWFIYQIDQIKVVSRLDIDNLGPAD